MARCYIHHAGNQGLFLQWDRRSETNRFKSRHLWHSCNAWNKALSGHFFHHLSHSEVVLLIPSGSLSSVGYGQAFTANQFGSFRDLSSITGGNVLVGLTGVETWFLANWLMSACSDWGIRLGECTQNIHSTQINSLFYKMPFPAWLSQGYLHSCGKN